MKGFGEQAIAKPLSAAATLRCQWEASEDVPTIQKAPKAPYSSLYLSLLLLMEL